MRLTAIIEKGENGWLVGQVEEFPPVISQGKTVEDLRANLADALKLYLEHPNQEHMNLNDLFFLKFV